MPRFHFDIYVGIGGELQPDAIGTDFADLPSAKMEALRRASDIVQNATTRTGIGQEWRIEVTNDSGHPLFFMDFIVSDGSNPMEGFNR